LADSFGGEILLVKTAVKLPSLGLSLWFTTGWSFFVRLVDLNKHHEAITSRPLMLQTVAKQTCHAGQTTVTITITHAKAHLVQAAL